MNLVIPMAGDSKIFKDAGFKYNKNFTEINHKPLFQRVFDSAKKIGEGNFIFVVNKEDAQKFHINKSLKLLAPDSRVIVAQGQTAGAGLDGLIMTMFADDNRRSFIKFDEENHVTMIREKEVISNEATVGIYNFSRGRDYVACADKMIELNLRVNNEFYVAPVYNIFIDGGAKVGFYSVGRLDAGMYGLGVPEDLKKFIANPLSKKIFGGAANV